MLKNIALFLAFVTVLFQFATTRVLWHKNEILDMQIKILKLEKEDAETKADILKGESNALINLNNALRIHYKLLTPSTTQSTTQP